MAECLEQRHSMASSKRAFPPGASSAPVEPGRRRGQPLFFHGMIAHHQPFPGRDCQTTAPAF
jgi:hypothetical protein